MEYYSLFITLFLILNLFVALINERSDELAKILESDNVVSEV